LFYEDRFLAVAARKDTLPRWYEKAGLLAGELNSRLDALDEVQKETGL
jgi:hypothetical protein